MKTKITKEQKEIKQLNRRLAKLQDENVWLDERLKEHDEAPIEPISFYTPEMYDAFVLEISRSNLSGLAKGLFVRLLKAAKNGNFLEDVK